MKPEQVNKLYYKLTPQEQAALVFEAAAKNDEGTVDAILPHVERKTYECVHADYMRRIHSLLCLSGYYGSEYWKNRALLLYACHKLEVGKHETEAAAMKLYAKIVAMEYSLAKTCALLQVDLAAVKTMAGCQPEDTFIDDDLAEVDAELVKQYSEAFSVLAKLK
jgi:hypothetical protein